VNKHRAQALNCQSVMGRLFQVKVKRKLRISLSDLFTKGPPGILAILPVLTAHYFHRAVYISSR